MPRANMIRWRDGAGWLVLSGGGDIQSAETGEIEAEALARVAAGDPMAYIWAAGDVETADKHLEALDRPRLEWLAPYEELANRIAQCSHE